MFTFVRLHTMTFQIAIQCICPSHLSLTLISQPKWGIRWFFSLNLRFSTCYHHDFFTVFWKILKQPVNLKLTSCLVFVFDRKLGPYGLGSCSRGAYMGEVAWSGRLSYIPWARILGRLTQHTLCSHIRLVWTNKATILGLQKTVSFQQRTLVCYCQWCSLKTSQLWKKNCRYKLLDVCMEENCIMCDTVF